jgi:hypothetical protein
MPKVSVMREVTELTGTELLDAYDAGPALDKEALRIELLRRIDPPAKQRKTPVNPTMALLKGKK